ncbi:MAG TPA: hypothetical protein VJ693_02675 [Ideonella sp.]|nr:hypothetical protein [Ideonella sp.]
MPVHLEPGEHIGPECVSAEVSFGETHLARDKVRVRLEPAAGGGAADADWVARVITSHVVDEPVIEIVLTVGCDRRFSRRFVALADPPSMTAQTPLNLPAPAATGVTPLAAADTDRSAPSAPAARVPAPAADRRHARATAPAADTASAPSRVRAAGRRNAATAAARAPAPAGGARLLLDAAGPRLKLDMEDPLLSASASASGEPAASAAAVAEPASGAERVRVLEKAVADLRRESQAERETTGALQVRLAEAEYRSRAVPWLASLLLLALGVAAWLTLRLRRQQDAAAVGAPHWWTPEAAEPEPAAGMAEPAELGPLDLPLPREMPPLTEATPTAPMPVTLSLERDLLPAPRSPEPPYERTTALAGPAPFAVMDTGAAELAMSREVSVEELLDLEQQADFFIALGQEDAAIDLLMSHLRSTGGLSPLPYTKLLEIYRRQGDREAYERIRARFNRRFNAYAPDWDAGPLSGRALEDYAQVVQHLQALWPQPLDAMAMLEAMLFRKDEAHELFDLPAYKDVLLLYAIARDLWQQGGGRQPAIDVLLPLGEEAA